MILPYVLQLKIFFQASYSFKWKTRINNVIFAFYTFNFKLVNI